MKDPTLLVLAAGMGSRYGGLKQVEPVGPSGEILLEYSVYDALQAGFGKLVFVIRRDLESAFRDTIGRRLEGKLPISYVYQELDLIPPGFSLPEGRVKPWGTGHAVLVAQPEVSDAPFAAINADDFYGRESYRLIAGALLQGRDDELFMVGFQLRNALSDHGTVSRGICRCAPGDLLQSIEEHTRVERSDGGARSHLEDGRTVLLSGDETVSMNMWGFPPSIFGHLERQFRAFLEERGGEAKSELYIPAVVDRLLREHAVRVRVLTSRDAWFGVTYPEDKPHVVEGIRQKIEQGEYPSELWK
ncbi:MAG: nucleotidyltransferase [Armatimonadetes bacterium]|nr:nucleotidyltransferase [Armatimonadota bacterium]